MAVNRTADFQQLCQQFAQQQHKHPTQQQQQRLSTTSQLLPAVFASNAIIASRVFCLSSIVEQHKPVAHTPMQENVAFNAAASDISKEVYQASKRLQQLTQLVRQNNMFNDPTAAINELAALVKHDITTINAQLDNLQEYVQSKRTARTSNTQAATHSDAIVAQMKTHLLHTTKGFKDILHVRQANLALQQQRKLQYGKTASSALGKPLTFASPHNKSESESESAKQQQQLEQPIDVSHALPRPQGVRQPTAAKGGGGVQHVGYTLPPPTDRYDVEATDTAPLIAPIAQAQVLASQHNHTAARADAVTQIESHVVDIGHMYSRLATILHEQEDLVRRIDDHVDDAMANVSAGENELLKYFAHLSSNRLLAVKVGAILLLFIVFFLFVLA